jgi:hypothetical protein
MEPMNVEEIKLLERIERDALITKFGDYETWYRSVGHAYLRQLELFYLKRFVDLSGQEIVVDAGCADGYALVQVAKGTWPRSLILPIVLNVVLNLCFTPIQFGLRNFLLASVVVVAVCATAMWTAFALYTHSKTLALALIPYIVWTGIASVLQITITWLNW